MLGAVQTSRGHWETERGDHRIDAHSESPQNHLQRQNPSHKGSTAQQLLLRLDHSASLCQYVPLSPDSHLALARSLARSLARPIALARCDAAAGGGAAAEEAVACVGLPLPVLPSPPPACTVFCPRRVAAAAFVAAAAAVAVFVL